MATCGASRWDQNVQFYDYRPETLRREPQSDEFVVAEAFIYDPDKTQVKAAITVLVSGKELEMDRAEAIRRGEAVRAQAVAKYRAQLPTQHPAMLLYDLTGRERLVKQKGRYERRGKFGARPALELESQELLFVFDGRLHLGRHLGWDGRHLVRRLGVLRPFGHHFSLILAFDDRVAARHQITAPKHLRHRKTSSVLCCLIAAE